MEDRCHLPLLGNSQSYLNKIVDGINSSRQPIRQDRRYDPNIELSATPSMNDGVGIFLIVDGEKMPR